MSVHNENDEYRIICEEYCDCNGEPFTIERCELIPPKLPLILAPVTDPLGISEVDFTNTQIIEGLKFTKRWDALFTTRFPFRVNTIFSTKGNSARYYIKRFVKRTPYNHFVYEVKRADCSELVASDFENLRKGRRIYFRGYFVNEK